jgi:LmbE family N-acetylglucosaminyl deacetylase
LSRGVLVQVQVPVTNPAPVAAEGASGLPEQRSVLAVCAHPDDESFGLGATLACFSASGAAVSVLCFTHGEASTLGADANPDLASVRRAELESAAEVLGVAPVSLLSYPDGALGDQGLDNLAAEVGLAAAQAGADLLLVFDEGGISGHPDHDAATGAALLAAGRLDLPVLAWALESAVADGLNAMFGAKFVGRGPHELDIALTVDRAQQHRAIACHKSQATGNPVLGRRLAVQGDREVFRWLRRAAAAS